VDLGAILLREGEGKGGDGMVEERGRDGREREGGRKGEDDCYSKHF